MDINYNYAAAIGSKAACGILTQDKDLGLNEETKPATSFTMEANLCGVRLLMAFWSRKLRIAFHHTEEPGQRGGIGCC